MSPFSSGKYLWAKQNENTRLNFIKSFKHQNFVSILANSIEHPCPNNAIASNVHSNENLGLMIRASHVSLYIVYQGT